MKTKLIGLIIALAIAAGHINAQNTFEVRAIGYDISDNLDLKAVSSLFGDARNLQEFEEELNDRKNGISNLDLNEDGFIDYLRVVELSENGKHLVCIQAVLDKDIFQDVATIEVERDRDNYTVLVVGNSFIYGPDYYIRPVYYRRPLIFGFFYGSMYRPWYSPYYWGYYPHWYKYRQPYPVYRYHRNINIHISSRNRYDHPQFHDQQHHADLYMKIGRNDYGQKHPDKSFEKRQSGYKNYHEIDMNRRSERPNAPVYRNEEKPMPGNGNVRRGSSTSGSGSNGIPQKMKSIDQSKQAKPAARERTGTRTEQKNPAVTDSPERKQVTTRSEERTRTTTKVGKSSSEKVEKSAPSKTEKVQPKSSTGNQKVRGNSESPVKRQSTGNRAKRGSNSSTEKGEDSQRR